MSKSLHSFISEINRLGKKVGNYLRGLEGGGMLHPQLVHLSVQGQ